MPKHEPWTSPHPRRSVVHLCVATLGSASQPHSLNMFENLFSDDRHAAAQTAQEIETCPGTSAKHGYGNASRFLIVAHRNCSFGIWTMPLMQYEELNSPARCAALGSPAATCSMLSTCALLWLQQWLKLCLISRDSSEIRRARRSISQFCLV